MAFLDGTQHVELAGYVGTQPVIVATVRAAVRLRHARRLHRAALGVRRLVIARPEALASLGDIAGHVAIAIEEVESPHPIQDLDRAQALVDRERGALEIAVAWEFRSGEHQDTWLMIDGSLAASPDWAGDPRMLGIVKSHAMLPFEGEELEVYLTLPHAHRTSIFQPASRRVTPLYSWGIRLHAFAGRDLFHGLLRVEAAATDATLALADTLSRYLLAERAPLSNDRRADRLLYGIHDVERYLRASGT